MMIISISNYAACHKPKGDFLAVGRHPSYIVRHKTAWIVVGCALMFIMTGTAIALPYAKNITVLHVFTLCTFCINPANVLSSSLLIRHA